MPANRVVGRAGQGYTGLGAMGRAQGAQSRWLPQTQTAMGRVGQRAAAGAGQMRQEYLTLWGRVAERERAEKIAALGDVGRELGLGIGKWRGRRADEEEERKRRFELSPFGQARRAVLDIPPPATPTAYEPFPDIPTGRRPGPWQSSEYDIEAILAGVRR